MSASTLRQLCLQTFANAGRSNRRDDDDDDILDDLSEFDAAKFVFCSMEINFD